MIGFLYFLLRTVEHNKNIRKYLKSECVAFRSTKEKFGGLSNMAGGYPIKIDQYLIYNSEALYQALKYPDYPEIQKQIIAVKSPIFAKKISRKYSEFERLDWVRIRFKVMKFCIELKLQYNFEKFSHVLLSTDNKSIVEFTRTDKVWGAVDVGSFYVGTNALGRLLMELRDKAKKSDKTFSAELPNIDNLNFLNINLHTAKFINNI